MNRIARACSRRNHFDYLAVAFLLAAASLLLFGRLLQPPAILSSVRPLERMPEPSSNSTGAWISGTGFAQNAVYPATQPPALHPGMKLFGSWLQKDRGTGAAVSSWFKANPKIAFLIAGYPDSNGNRLAVEVVAQNGRSIQIRISPVTDPGEHWALYTVSLPAQTNWSKVRVIANDSATGPQGWLGFSLPGVPPQSASMFHIRELILLLLALATGVVLFLAPGLLMRAWFLHRKGRLFSAVWLPVVGLLYAVLAGVAAWKGPRVIPPSAMAAAFIWALLITCTVALCRSPLSAILERNEKRMIAVVLALVLIASAKATYSLGPKGELYGGTISRTLEVGDRSDSRVNYHLVQIVANRWGAHSVNANRLLAPWDFSQRGPVAGLAAATLVLASPAKVGARMPDQEWSIFDDQGFAAYRSAMIVMSACSLIAVFGLMRLLQTSEWALLSFLVAATTPFILHEIYFTWPKLLTGCLMLVSAYLILRLRFMRAGLMCGFAYLTHPLALIWVPSLFGLMLVKNNRHRPVNARFGIARFTRYALRFGCGLGFFIALWRVINRGVYHQNGFLVYFQLADRLPVTLHNWLWIRWESVLNTLAPLHLFIFDKGNSSINSLSGPSSEIIHFFFQYWNTMPFGVGILFFFPFCALLVIAARRWPGLLTLVWVLPFLLFALYWGAASSGLMREGLHPWFLGLLCLGLLVWSRMPARLSWLGKLCGVCLLLRALEIVAMLLLPTLAANKHFVNPEYAFTDTLCLVTMVGGSCALAYLTYRQALSSTHKADS